MRARTALQSTDKIIVTLGTYATMLLASFVVDAPLANNGLTRVACAALAGYVYDRLTYKDPKDALVARIRAQQVRQEGQAAAAKCQQPLI